MEKRAFLAVALSLLLLFVWSTYVERTHPPARPAPPSTEAAPGGATAPEAPAPGVPAPPMPAGDLTAPPGGAEVEVSTPLYRARFSAAGALLTQFALARYRVGVAKDSPRVDLVRDRRLLPLAVDLGAPGGPRPGDEWQASPERLDLAGHDEGTLRFVWSRGKIEIEKRLTFHADSYLADLAVAVRNRSASEELADELGIEVAAGGDPELLSDRGMGGFAVSTRSMGKVVHTPFGSVKEGKDLGGGIQWGGVEDKYFFLGILPEGIDSDPRAVEERRAVTARAESTSEGVAGLVLRLRLPRVLIPPGGHTEHRFRLYLGPKEYDTLKGAGAGLEGSIDFGFFGAVAWFFYRILKMLNALLGNYGWAIIGLTALVRLVMLPLSHSQFRSMKVMQKIQPQMKAIQEKYKDDQARQNKEVWDLMRRYKVNPLGCILPLLLQFPIFIALYAVLLNALELRHASFLWLRDLSAPDQIFQVCWGTFCFHARLLPVVMGGTMVAQSATSPQSGDPSQVKLMTYGMPLMFLVMFWNFPSGLNLYWLVQNLFSIVQQVWLNRKFAREGLA